MHEVVVVTGASRGIGLGIAVGLAEAGYRVIAIARSMSTELEAVLAWHENIRFHAADLSDIAGLSGLARRLRDEFTIYGLVNNAGIGTAGILSTMPDDKIAELIQMNVTAPITLTKYLLRSMMTARTGRVINLSSVVATTGYSGLSAYAASKAALLGFTRSLAREVGSLGITVNAIAPGFIDTAMTHGLTEPQRQQIARRSALHRMAGVSDVAAAVVYLMGESGRNITGTVLTVDAGNTA